MAQPAPVTPPHQIIPDYSLSPSPSHDHDHDHDHDNNSSSSNSSKTAFTLPRTTSPDNHHRNHSLPSSNPPSRRSSRSSSFFSSSPTNMNVTAAAAPFEVPKSWQTAMSMVSINAGLYPQQVLQHYYKLYPLQVAAHPRYTELDVWRSRRARERGIRALRVHHADADPARIYLVFILLDELDPATGQPVLRLITNTSIRHVLEEPYSNCPLWLPVRVVTTTATAPGVSGNNNKTEAAAAAAAVGPEFDPSLPDRSTPYQIIPCCEDWAACADFDAPMSDEEKKVPQLVDRLIEEMRRKSALLVAKDDEIAKLLLQQSQAQEKLQQQEDEKKGAEAAAAAAGGGGGGGGGGGAAATAAAMAAQQVHAAFDTEALVQYWWAGAAFMVFCVVLLLR